MSKQLRRMRWDIRKQVIKNGIVQTILSCAICLLILSFCGKYSYFGILPFISDSNYNPVKIVTVREILNATFTTNNIVLDPDVSGIGMTVPNQMQRNISSSQKRKNESLIMQGESVTELPIDGIFEERKADAEKACLDMLNVGTIKEGKASMGYTSSAIKDEKYPSSNFDKIAGLVNQSRLVQFRRTVQSPDYPSQNKVVEIRWCPVFKAASTAWFAVFTKLSKALTTNAVVQIKQGRIGFLDLAKTFHLLMPRIYDKSVHPFKYSMIVVRHPFTRLLSAYRDKIERVKDRLYYYNKFSTKIIARFRLKSKLGPIERKSKDKDSSLKVPTFEEFVHYVLSIEPWKLDGHWRPMFLDCNPCHRAFDFVLKVETLNSDKDKVMEYLHVSPSDPQYKEVEDVWVRWNNPSRTNQPIRNESYYYGQLKLDDIEKLYNLYEPDFRIFNYSPEAYFLMGKDV